MSNTVKVSITLAQNQTVISINRKIFYNDEVKVYFNGALQTVSSDFDLTINTFAFNAQIILKNKTIKTGDILLLVIKYQISRFTKFSSYGNYSVALLDKELERIYGILEQLNSRFDSVLRLSEADTGSLPELPLKSNRLNKTLAFDENGNPKLI